MVQMKSCLAVLEELGLKPERTITLLNKVDKLEDMTALRTAETLFPRALPISAATGKGLERLLEEVSSMALGQEVSVSIRTPSANGKLLNMLKAQGNILKTDYSDTMVEVRAQLPERLLERVRQMGATVRVVRPNKKRSKPTSKS